MTGGHTSDTVKHIFDGAAALTVIGTLMSWLPAVAAIFTIVWTGFRIIEEWEKFKTRRMARD